MVTEKEPGRQRKGGWGGGDQIAKGLERQGEEFGLDSVGGGQLPKSFERRRDMTRASGRRTGQNWRLRPEVGVAVVQVGDDNDDDDRAWTQVVVGEGEEEGQMPFLFVCYRWN